MKLSILVTSQTRPEELFRFFESINNQRELDFSNLQIIFVDQGSNYGCFNILNPIINKIYIKYHPCGLSEARNQGLKYVTGDYIAFGDDDSWYDNGTLVKIQYCIEHNNLDGVGTRICNEEDIPYSRYSSKKRLLTFTEHCGISSASMFLRFDKTINFDENIGLGSKYGLSSGEETDYLWSFMERHPTSKIEYHPEIIVRHPVFQFQNFNNYFDKCFCYAKGEGYIIQKHNLPLLYKFKKLLRPFLGVIIYSCCNSFKCKKSFYTLKGRIIGMNFKLNK